MNRTTCPVFMLTLTLVIFGLVACSDDEIINEPEAFAVTITVTDSAGSPVPGLKLTMAPETAFYFDGKAGDSTPLPLLFENGISSLHPNPFWPAITIDYSTETISHTRLSVEDIEGTEVRLLFNGPLEAGDRSIMWNSRNDAGDQLPTGVYRVHMVQTDADADTVIFDSTRLALLAIWDSEYLPAGTTDSDGKIVFTDQRLFPFLYNIDDLTATDENGEIIGPMEISADMRFYLTDPATGFSMRYNRDISGSASLNFTWNPGAATARKLPPKADESAAHFDTKTAAHPDAPDKSPYAFPRSKACEG